MSTQGTRRAATPRSTRGLVVGGIALVLVLVLGIVWWATRGGDEAPSDEPEAAATGSTELPVTDPEPADRSLIDFSCESVDGSWQAAGTVINTVSRATQYRVEIRVVGPDQALLGTAVDRFDLKAGASRAVEFDAVHEAVEGSVCQPVVTRSAAS